MGQEEEKMFLFKKEDMRPFREKHRSFDLSHTCRVCTTGQTTASTRASALPDGTRTFQSTKKVAWFTRSGEQRIKNCKTYKPTTVRKLTHSHVVYAGEWLTCTGSCRRRGGGPFPHVLLSGSTSRHTETDLFLNGQQIENLPPFFPKHLLWQCKLS